VFGPSGPTLSSERRSRFEADRAVLAETMPKVRHLVLADGGGAIAQGDVDVDVGAGCFEPVEIRMEFGREYPPKPPTVLDHGRRWRPTPDRHMFENYSFCLWLAGVDMPELATPEALRNFTLQVLLFLRDQFVFDDLDRWPGHDWPHGESAAYGKYVVERLRVATMAEFDSLWPLVVGARARPNRACACGSPLPYARCHRSAVRDVSWIGRRGDRGLIATAARAHLA
jgi:hypothetical protein